MGKTEFVKGEVICTAGDKIDNLFFITSGDVVTDFNGKTFNLGASDAIGFCGLNTGVYSQTYTADSDVSVFSYPYEDIHTLQKIMGENPSISNLLINSMCRQIANILGYWSGLKRQSDGALDFYNETYGEYERLCKLYAFTAKKLPVLPEMAAGIELFENWEHDYYMEVKATEPKVLKHFFSKAPVALGFLFRGSVDIKSISRSCEAYIEYLKEISPIFLNDDGHDLFSLISELHTSSINVKGANEAISPILKRLAGVIINLPNIDNESFRERASAHMDNLTDVKTTGGAQTAAGGASNGGLKQNLADSLNVILEYSGSPEEQRNKFARQVYDYRAYPDKNGSDDIIYRLRRELAQSFSEIYRDVFIKTLKDPNIPTIIKMFLNFGYIDAELAGYDNADYLYSIADRLKGDPENGVYTIYEWLMTIYKGDREPSRNDFDEDFTAHVQELKIARKINEEEAKRLLKDKDAKLLFELENVFPIVNKITYGRITTYCPLLAEDNLHRDLEATLITPQKLHDGLNEILAVDYSAYYRETVFTDEKAGIPKEFVHTEIRPEFILTPNAGIRGTMWQEIEGRRRDTPARMFIPIFFMDDLNKLLIRLTGEFRWELCKRIQGPRWTELSDPSLTSEMFDYLQFYKSNRDLSADAKAAVKTELVKARNQFKTVFVSNYMDWLLYEANGSPRLNKIARRILLNYCPFNADTREKLSTNPQYTEIINRFRIKVQQREQRLSRIMQKITQENKKVPQEFHDEMEFVLR